MCVGEGKYLWWGNCRLIISEFVFVKDCVSEIYDKHVDE